MKFSIRLVALLAGLAAGIPSKVDKRDLEAEALEEYCGIEGFETEDLGEPQVLMNLVTGCGNQADVKSGLAVLNQIIADSEGDIDKIKNHIMSLSRDAPGTLTGMYTALKSPPTKNGVALGGWPGAIPAGAIILYDFINANIGEKGLFDPSTKAGQWIRTNPISGKPGQPSPFEFAPGGYYSEFYRRTQKCVPFKDKSEWYWSQDVKRCKIWHDEKQCDTSYAYDAATDNGKEQERICDMEIKKNQITPQEREEQIGREEASCVRPQWSCQSFDVSGTVASRVGTSDWKFKYCMGEDESSKAVCRSNGGTPFMGRAKTPDEIEEEKEKLRQKDEANCVRPRLSCRGWNGKFIYCMENDESAKNECKRNGWLPG
ncbi:hypothetical protein EYZ11_011497 [Aspergillus tanneri]|uniref:Uncharacterized protein n=1 Tax=Aspergillus tanneri TaxID=1220188 RepID=A0A4S3J4T0_9EURO|nr:hypothetical protein EYZ11_011497 [Aspergillus tanneri]